MTSMYGLALEYAARDLDRVIPVLTSCAPVFNAVTPRAIMGCFVSKHTLSLLERSPGFPWVTNLDIDGWDFTDDVVRHFADQTMQLLDIRFASCSITDGISDYLNDSLPDLKYFGAENCDLITTKFWTAMLQNKSERVRVCAAYDITTQARASKEFREEAAVNGMIQVLSKLLSEPTMLASSHGYYLCALREVCYKNCNLKRSHLEQLLVPIVELLLSKDPTLRRDCVWFLSMALEEKQELMDLVLERTKIFDVVREMVEMDDVLCVYPAVQVLGNLSFAATSSLEYLLNWNSFTLLKKHLSVTRTSKDQKATRKEICWMTSNMLLTRKGELMDHPEFFDAILENLCDNVLENAIAREAAICIANLCNFQPDVTDEVKKAVARFVLRHKTIAAVMGYLDRVCESVTEKELAASPTSASSIYAVVLWLLDAFKFLIEEEKVLRRERRKKERAEREERGGGGGGAAAAAEKGGGRGDIDDDDAALFDTDDSDSEINPVAKRDLRKEEALTLWELKRARDRKTPLTARGDGCGTDIFQNIANVFSHDTWICSRVKHLSKLVTQSVFVDEEEKQSASSSCE